MAMSTEGHKLVWQEDDAPDPDKEGVHEAWERLYGDELDLSKAQDMQQDGADD